MTDRGLSAYTGDHRTKGALGEFLNQIEKGNILPGSVLIIEALDRLSREGMLEAIHLLTGILLKGIDLYTAMDDKHFQKTTYDLSDLIISATKLQQGHEESEKKSIRLLAAWQVKRELTRNGGRKLTARCPAWLKLSKDLKSFIILPERAQAVNQIFEMKLTGKGTGSIESSLNQEDVWKPTRGWQKSYIHKILRNPAVHGEYQPHRKVRDEETGSYKRVPEGAPILDYYPSIVDKDLFSRVQDVIERNRKLAGNAGGRNGIVNNLFGHIAVCAACGGPMAFVSKGRPPKGRQYLKCDNARRGLGCIKATFRYDRLEPLILGYCKGLDVRDILPGKGQRQSELSILQSQRQAIEGNLGQIKSKIENVLDSIAGTESRAVRKVLEERVDRMLADRAQLEAEKDALTGKIEKLTNGEQVTSERLRSVWELIEKMADLEGKDRSDLRLNLRAKLRQLIKRMEVETGYSLLNGKPYQAFTLHFTDVATRTLLLHDGRLIVEYEEGFRRKGICRFVDGEIVDVDFEPTDEELEHMSAIDMGIAKRL
ncbi:recombinase family protein [Thermodesulfobacteriota bacterium]